MEEQNANYWINKLQLKEHTEGGYFREVYRKKDNIYGRDLATSIYYLLPSGMPSKLHRLRNDEVWYYHLGSPLKLFFFSQTRGLEEHKLGPNPEKSQEFSKVIPAETIFGAEVIEQDSFSLVSCNMSPGFEYEDFELLSREKLINLFPDYTELIKKLT
ncbi:MAG: cupin domain-containing protein [Bacteroidota bacterium]